VIEGDVAKRDFLAWFMKGDRVNAVAGQNRPHQVLTIRKAMEEGALTRSDFKKWEI